MVDDECAGTVEDHDPHRLLRPQGRAPITECTRTQLVQIEVAVAEIEQLRAELVLVAVDVLLDEAVRLQRPQQAVDGALREPSRDELA